MNDGKRPAKRLIFIFIPIIAFVIGILIMDMAQSLDLDQRLFKSPSKPSFDFSASNDEISEEIGIFTDETVPLEREPASQLAMFQLPSFDVYFIQSATFTNPKSALDHASQLLKNGYSAVVYTDRVDRVFIAAALDQETADTLKSDYEDQFQKLSVYKLTLQPTTGQISREESATALKQAAEIQIEVWQKQVTWLLEHPQSKLTKGTIKALIKDQTALLESEKAFVDSVTAADLESVHHGHLIQLIAWQREYLDQLASEKVLTDGIKWQMLMEQWLMYGGM